MSKNIPILNLVLFLLTISILSVVSEAKSDGDKKYQFDVTGYVGMDIGQIVKGAGVYDLNGAAPYRPWIHEPLLMLMLETTLNEQIQIFTGIGAQIWYNTINQQLQIPRSWVFTKYLDVFIHRAEGVASFPNTDNPVFQIGFGIFPYKYNEDARNLGEYLFRSTAYPAVVFGGFENAFRSLAGLRASLRKKNLHVDLIANMETDVQPFHDVSLAAVADYDIANVVKVGAGVQFYHLISVNEDVTTPHRPDQYDLNGYIEANGDTAYYTHRGVKLMGRLRFDPKRIFVREGDDFGIWGKEDFKIYGEIAVLGAKNYPDQVDTMGDGSPRDPYIGYDDITKKMPIMFGINIPTTKWGLDVLAVEAEWFGIPYANDPFRVIVNVYPRPEPYAEDKIYTNDNWKWTIYAKRHIGEHFFVTLMFARDHVILRTKSDQFLERASADALISTQDWWWVTRIGFDF